jgi:hypothetical protein
LDSAGNIIGHVSTISGLSSGRNRPPLLMLRTGIPALAVQQLAKTTANPAEIKRIANLDSQVPKTAVKPKKSTPECPAAAGP